LLKSVCPVAERELEPLKRPPGGPVSSLLPSGPSILTRPLVALLASVVLLGTTPLVTVADAKPKPVKTKVKSDPEPYGGDGRRN
jgi:hypothetical protein